MSQMATTSPSRPAWSASLDALAADADAGEPQFVLERGAATLRELHTPTPINAAASMNSRRDADIRSNSP